MPPYFEQEVLFSTQQQRQQPNLAGGSTLKGSKEHASDRHPQRKMFILVFFRGGGGLETSYKLLVSGTLLEASSRIYKAFLSSNESVLTPFLTKWYSQTSIILTFLFGPDLISP